MAFNKKVSKDYDVIIGMSSSVDGDIKSEGSIRIDGKVSGSIVSKGDVIVGPQAVVNADIEANFCEISGQVVGSVDSVTSLKIYSSGSLKGDINVSSFTIDEGGVFKGNCEINPQTTKPKEVHKKQNQNQKQNEQKTKKTVG